MNRLVTSIPARLFRQPGVLQKCFTLKTSFAIRLPFKGVDFRHLSNTSIPVTSVNEDDVKSPQEEITKSESITDRLKRLSTEAAVESDFTERKSFAADDDDDSDYGHRGRRYNSVKEETVDLEQEELENIDPEKPLESITDRLRRLSTSSVEDFEPSPGVKLARLKAKARYANLEREYQSRYPHRADHGFRKSYNFNERDRYNPNRRYFSTNSVNRVDNSNAVIDRLRRLSVSSSSVGSDYDPASEKSENTYNVNKRQQYSLRKGKNDFLSSKYKSTNEKRHDNSFWNEGGKQTTYTSNSINRHKTGKLNTSFKKLNAKAIPDDYFENNFEDDNFDDDKPKQPIKDLAVESDPDTFGTLSLKETASVSNDSILDEDSTIYNDEEDDIKFKPYDNWTQRKLLFKIKELVKDNKLGEAIDTLTSAHRDGGFYMEKNEMTYLYGIVIAVCAKVGYVQMSFKLFSDMKKRGLKPRQGVYTSLFNACANSMWDAEENINRIQMLRQNMLNKGIEPNLINCHAMIKAYGRCGDLQSAFAVVDEIKNQKQLTTETFNFLLQACISDKENGFRHVIVTWRKMKKLRLRPNIYTYNLLLRAVRECSIQHLGPVSSPMLKQNLTTKHEKPLLPAILDSQDRENMIDIICNPRTNDSEETALVSSSMKDEEIIKTLAIAENRLALFGRLEGIISSLSRDRVEPDIKTMMELVQIVHPDEFMDLMNLLTKFNIKPDISFFNAMIKKYQYWRLEFQCVPVLQLIGQYHLSPNIMTWGVLCLGCKSWVEARSLLNEMEEANFLPNLIIMSTFLSQAVFTFDPLYVLRLMEELKNREMKPDNNFLIKLQNFRDTVQKGIVSLEMGKPVNPPELASSIESNPYFEKEFVTFKKRYASWLKETEIFIESRDPWESDFKKRYPPKSKPKIDAKMMDSELLRNSSL